MNLGYLFKESFSGLRRATLSSIVAITVITVALSLFGLFLIITFNVSRLVEDLRSRVELEAFLDKSLDTPASRKIERSIAATEGVESVMFISKAEAARILKSVMGANDIFDLVDTNPLPASFKIRLKPEFRNLDGVIAIAKSVESIDGVEEVSYKKELLEALDQQANNLGRINLGLIVVTAVAAIFLVSNTIKLSIYSKRDLIKTMKLVGAKNSFIAGPFLLEGIIQGGLGSAFAVGILYFTVRAVRRYLIGSLAMTWETSAIIVGFGILLGLIGSWISVRFFLKEKISDL